MWEFLSGLSSRSDRVLAIATHLDAFPALLPVPKLIVISSDPVMTSGCVGWTARHLIDQVGVLSAFERATDGRTSKLREAASPNIVRVGFERSNTFLSVVVVHSEVKVICAAYKPVLAGNESDGSHWDLGDFECLDQSACLVIPDEDIASVETGLAVRYHVHAFVVRFAVFEGERRGQTWMSGTTERAVKPVSMKSTYQYSEARQKPLTMTHGCVGWKSIALTRDERASSLRWRVMDDGEK
jgi:hypothetical protein